MGSRLSASVPRSSGQSAENSASTSRSETKRSPNLRVYGSPKNSKNSTEPSGVKFTMEEIVKATKNFSPNFRIGQGGFGTVYKACMNDGTVVAIKRARKKEYDMHMGTEFQSEVHILGQVEHMHLVRFYGYLEHGNERFIVVEYVPNGTLREHLDCKYGTTLEVVSRIQIAIDVAHAITYLHMYTEHPIIHRDIKSSNVLLTNDYRAKVADFGFARLGADGEMGDTHVSTMVKGTTGYLDPEYLCTNQLTVKSDVYSFGVLLVELITGRRPIEPKHDQKERITALWALKNFRKGDTIVVFDPRLQRSPANIFAAERILELSMQCLAPHRNNRPSMRKCSEILWTIRSDHKSLQDK